MSSCLNWDSSFQKACLLFWLSFTSQITVSIFICRLRPPTKRHRFLPQMVKSLQGGDQNLPADVSQVIDLLERHCLAPDGSLVSKSAFYDLQQVHSHFVNLIRLFKPQNFKILINFFLIFCRREKKCLERGCGI